MTRREYEDLLLSAAEGFERIWKTLNPEGRHISLFVVDGSLHICDYDSPANPMATRFADGVRSYSTGEMSDEDSGEAATDVGSE